MTLTEVSFYGRKFAPFFILAFIVLLIMYFSIKVLFLWLSLNEKHEIVYNPIFNEMKALQITDATSSAKHSYIMDTVEGEPVTATEAAYVFYIPESKFRFGYQEKMYLMAKTLGFSPDTKHTLVGNEADFTEQKKSLRIDIMNFNYKYDTKIQDSPELWTNNGTPDKEEAQNRAVDFLKSLDRYPDDLAQGRMNIVYLQYDKVSSQTAVVQDFREANMVEVDFYRADIDQYPIVSPRYFNSQNYVTMVVNGGAYIVVSSQIRFFEKSTEQVGLYPVIDGPAAFAKLATGSGYIISGANIEKKNIPIKRMYLGYYDTEIYQEYMMPVYVFLGDDNFVAYVPAIPDRWIIDDSTLK
jgi:hypothetical protein